MLWFIIIIIISWPLMLRHDLQFCLTSYYAFLMYYHQLPTIFVQTQPHAFKTFQRNLLCLDCHKILLDQAKIPIFISDIALFTQPQRQGTLPA